MVLLNWILWTDYTNVLKVGELFDIKKPKLIVGISLQVVPSETHLLVHFCVAPPTVKEGGCCVTSRAKRWYVTSKLIQLSSRSHSFSLL